jgi:hypothetical protein
MIGQFISRLGRLFTIGEVSRAFNVTFRSPTGHAFILPDLAEFCYAAEPAPKSSDLFVQGRAAGRRDVWLHISEYLHLTEEELFALYRGRSIKQEENNG